jgi:hypothetical protein
MMDKRAWLLLLPLIFAPPVSVHGQDCCAPGGGLTARIAESAAGGGRQLVFPRRYRTRKHHLGIDAGAEAGFTDASDAKTSFATPRLEYNGVWGGFDFYGAAFYTAASGHPVSHQADFAENIGYTLNLPGVSALTFRLDNEDIVTFAPGSPEFAYGAVTPSLAYGKTFDFGGLTLEAGFPIGYRPDFLPASYFTLGYEHASGFKAGISAHFAVSPEQSYSGTALTLAYAREWFYGTVALSADRDFKTFGIRPYLEFFISRFTLWAGAEFGGLGGEFAISPYAGAKYTF